MKHYYKIEDKVEIRLIILYTLMRASRPLTAYEISHVVLGSAIIDFFDIHDALAFLTDAGEIYMLRDIDDKIIYSLTDSGKLGAENFSDKIPLQVKEYTDDCLSVLIKEQKKQRSVIAKSVPINFSEYNTHLELNDGDNTLLSMDVYAGDESSAKLMCKNFKRNTNKICDLLFNMLMKPLDGEDNE